MAWSLLDLQNQIASEMDQSPTAPTVGGNDWNIRLNALNRALFDWAEAYDWRALLKIHNGLISTSTGNASYALPADFRKLDGFPAITYDGTNTVQFTPIDATKNRQYLDTDKYIDILGNDKDGKVLYIHSNALVSGASIQFTYWASPASLATSTQLTECPDPTFLVQRGLYYLYKGREDGRFPEAKVESDRILARLIEGENTLGQAHSDNMIHNWNDSRFGFKIGRDG
jgi:hypothetical protein